MTIDDLRWAEHNCDELVEYWGSRDARDVVTVDYMRQQKRLWQARAGRFRAAAEAMEREGKRDE